MPVPPPVSIPTLLNAIRLAAGSGGSGGAAWGSITGTLSAQTDLQTALDARLLLSGGTMTGALVNSTAGAASAPPLYLTGALNVAGTGTTTFPHIFHQPTGATAATTWSSGANAGTVFGANETTGFVGNYADFRTAGTFRFGINYLGGIRMASYGTNIAIYDGDNTTLRGSFNQGRWAGLDGFSSNNWVALGANGYPEVAIRASGTIGWSVDGTFYGTNDLIIKRKAAATLQLGLDAAGVTNQMITAASRITSDGVGANLTIAGGNGRGGAGGSLIFSYYTTAAAATIGTLKTALTLDTTGLLTFADAVNMAFNGTTGTKIGTSSSQKLAFWGNSPTIRPAVGGASASYTNNGGTALTETDTWDGYTLGQIVSAIRLIGLLD